MEQPNSLRAKLKVLAVKSYQQFLKRPLFYLLLFSLLLRLLYLSWNHPLWWDTHVYIGMGKYIFSDGQFGIWESFRPLVHPFILGLLWFSNLDPLIYGKILDVIFSLTAVYLTYLIGRKIFNETIGLMAAFIFSFTALFVMFTGLILTEPLAITLGLLGFYLCLQPTKKSYLLLGGILIGLSLLTKFPQGLILPAALLIVLLAKEKLFWKIKRAAILVLGFAVPLVPYLIFNYYRYQNPWEPFIGGSWIMTTATWIYGSGPTFYLRQFFLQYWIYLFFFGYLYYFFHLKHWQDSNKSALLSSAVLFILYFTIMVPRKEIRYLVTALPFLAVMVAFTIKELYHYFQLHQRPLLRPKGFVIVCLLLSLINLPTGLYFENIPDFQEEIQTTIQEYNITGTVLTSNPSFVSFVDNYVVIMRSGMEYGPLIYEEQQGRYELLFLNDCDLICPPDEENCTSAKADLLQQIGLENRNVFNQSYKNCTYGIYLPK